MIQIPESTKINPINIHVANNTFNIYEWEIKIGEWNMPPWISFIGAIIPLFLSYNLLKLKKKR